MASGASLVHSGEGDFSIGGSVVHGFEHLLAGAYADFGAVLYEDSFVFILFDI